MSNAGYQDLEEREPSQTETNIDSDLVKPFEVHSFYDDHISATYSTSTEAIMEPKKTAEERKKPPANYVLESVRPPWPPTCTTNVEENPFKIPQPSEESVCSPSKCKRTLEERQIEEEERRREKRERGRIPTESELTLSPSKAARERNNPIAIDNAQDIRMCRPPRVPRTRTRQENSEESVNYPPRQEDEDARRRIQNRRTTVGSCSRLEDPAPAPAAKNGIGPQEGQGSTDDAV